MTFAKRIHGDRPLPRNSLRWRLPAFFGGLVVLMLLTFLWVSFQEVEATLIGAGRERAEITAEQIAEIVSDAISEAAIENAQLTAGADLRAFLLYQTDVTEAAVRLSLSPYTRQQFHRLEVWDHGGSLLLELSSPSAANSAGVVMEFPRGEAPVRESAREKSSARPIERHLSPTNSLPSAESRCSSLKCWTRTSSSAKW